MIRFIKLAALSMLLLGIAGNVSVAAPDNKHKAAEDEVEFTATPVSQNRRF